MNRNTQYHLDKQLLAMDRERRALWPQRHQTIEINPPIPRGWIRHWRLTDKAKQRHDAAKLQIILAEINNPRHHWRKDFQPQKRRRRRMIDNTQPLRAIREWRWQRLGWPEDWKIHFRKIRINVDRYDETEAYRFFREDLFELFTERHYIRRLPVLNPEAESREAEIEQILSQNHFYLRLDRLVGCHWHRDPDPRQKKLDRLAAKRIREAYEGDWEAEARRKAISPHLCFHPFQIIKVM